VRLPTRSTACGEPRSQGSPPHRPALHPHPSGQYPGGESRDGPSNVRAAAGKSAPSLWTWAAGDVLARTPVLYWPSAETRRHEVLRSNLGDVVAPPRSGPSAPSYRTSPSTNGSSPVVCHTRWPLWRTSERRTASSGHGSEQDAGHRWQPLADAALGRPAVAGRGSIDLELSVVDQPTPDHSLGRGAVDQLLEGSLWRVGAPDQAVRARRQVERPTRRFADGEVRPGVADRPVDRQP